SEDVVFTTKTRKEISRIEWFKLEDLPGWGPSRVPGKFFLITPFMQELRSWISQRKRQMQLEASKDYNVTPQVVHSLTTASFIPVTNTNRKGKKGKEKQKPIRRASLQPYPDGTTPRHAHSSSFDFSSDEITGGSQEGVLSQSVASGFNLVELLASGKYNPLGMYSSQSSSPESPRAIPAIPPLNRSRTDTITLSSDGLRRIDSSTMQHIPASSRDASDGIKSGKESNRNAQELLNLFTNEATRQSPAGHSNEQTPRPRPVSIPYGSLHTLPTYPSNPLQASSSMPSLHPQSTGQDRVTSFGSSQQMPPLLTSLHSQPGGSVHAFRDGQSLTSRYQENPRSPPSSRQTNGPLLKVEGQPSSHPAGLYPYRPSSVPIQDSPLQRSHSLHTLPNYGSYAPTAANSSALPSKPTSARMSPAVSAPRNVPHAHQLLALFQDETA
ncbi:mRNA-decapping enzyme subunit 2, partial [Serendipita sp. 399]